MQNMDLISKKKIAAIVNTATILGYRLIFERFILLCTWHPMLSRNGH